MNILSTLAGAVVLGSSAYAMCTIPPGTYPFAFTASVIIFCHGIFDVITGATEKEDGSYSIEFVKTISNVPDQRYLIPLMLVNVELMQKTGTNAVVWGHCLGALPLTIYAVLEFLNFGYLTEFMQGDANIYDLTLWGNIVVLYYLALNENNIGYGCMAASELLCYFLEKFRYELRTTRIARTLGESALCIMSSVVLAG